MCPVKIPSKIRYNFTLEHGTRLQTAHGVWGGINAQGEIEMNFYHESDALPQFMEQIVSPDGSLGHEILPEDGEPREVERRIHTRVLLNYNTARGVLEWLEEQLDILDEDGAQGMYREPDSGVKQ
ncbi:MAG: hypothetical protein LBR31_09070 [Desulfovibrio sp.]|jgi:hypothetical protein|nr:hypothetical protein [Desulfovibrio sp.]